MPATAPKDGADKGTDYCYESTGGASGTGKDPYVGSYPSPSREGDEAYAVTGGAGDKTGDGKGSRGANE